MKNAYGEVTTTNIQKAKEIACHIIEGIAFTAIVVAWCWVCCL